MKEDYENNYIPELSDDDEKVPELKQNEISEKLGIGLITVLALWVLTFLILKSMGIISALIMRICIYPVVVGILIAYVVIKNKNNRI